MAPKHVNGNQQGIRESKDINWKLIKAFQL